MARTPHGSFRDEPVMVWAWDIEDRALRRIEPGSAHALRAQCRSGRLVCPVSVCDSPALNTRAGYTNRWGTYVRDGFRHLVSPTPDHSPESLAHITGKLMVAAWLETLGWQVEVERYDTQADRRPDVTAVRSGARLAIEVQYSRLTTQLWAERDADLRAAGWHVVWLWGRATRTLTTPLTTIMHRQLERGDRVLFIDADAGQFGIPWIAGARRRRHAPDRGPCPGDPEARTLWCPPEEFNVATDGLWHPIDTDLDDGIRSERKSLLEALTSVIDQRRARLQRAAATRAQRPQVRQEYQRAHTDPGSRRSAPAYSTCYAQFVGDLLSATSVARSDLAVLGTDEYVYGPPEAWHALVLLLVHAEEPITVDDVVDVIRRRFAHNPRGVRTAVEGILQRWVASSIIRIRDGRIEPCGTYRHRLAPPAARTVEPSGPITEPNGQTSLPF